MSRRSSRDAAITHEVRGSSTAPGPMSGVATLHVKIDQALQVSLLSEEGRHDVRGRWDRIRWGHYEPLADGVAHAVAALLKLPQKSVRTNGSILVDRGVAVPRLVIEVPAESKERVAKESVRSAIQYVVDRVTGAATLEDDAGATVAMPEVVAADDPVAAGECLAAGDPGKGQMGRGNGESLADSTRTSSGFDAATTARLQSVARRVLSKLGGTTLPDACSIEIDGLSAPPLVLSGRCADKPVTPSTGPKLETFECYVDGFIRSRHTVYLIDVAGNGTAREVAIATEWERRVAIYATNRYRGRKFRTTVAVERRGEKVTRELDALVLLPR